MPVVLVLYPFRDKPFAYHFRCFSFIFLNFTYSAFYFTFQPWTDNQFLILIRRQKLVKIFDGFNESFA